MRKKTFLLFFVVCFAMSCSSLTTTDNFATPSPSATIIPFPQTPLPFDYLVKLPENEFLFVTLYDNDYTCLDNLCACPVSEAPSISYKFIEGMLVLNKYHLEGVPNSWRAFVENNTFTVLTDFSSQWYAELKSFPMFPITTSEGNFIVLGVDSQGKIQVKHNNGYSILAVGESLNLEQPEQVESYCKVLHKYSITNYGFIKNENVRFFREDENW